MTQLTDEEVRFLVRAGVAAPSADNRHVVEFGRSGGGLRLFADRVAVENAVPHRKMFHELAFGGIIENIELAAGALGRTTTLRRHTLWSTDPVVAEFTFSDASPTPRKDALLDAVFDRTTNRRLYSRGRDVPRKALDELAMSASALPDVRIDWLDDPGRRSRVLRVVFDAERQRFANERLHGELFEAIRFDVGWRESAEHGLPPGALEIELPFRPVFRALRRWNVQRVANALGGAPLLALRAAWLPARSAPHIALLSTSASASADLVDAGRALQRLWLAATLRSIAFQPLAASIALASQEPREAWVDRSVVLRMRREFDALAPGRRPVMLARLGYASAPSVRSSRPPVEAYLRDGVQ